MVGWRDEGTARLRIALDDGGRSVPASLFQRAPLRILFPRPGPEEPLSAVLLNTGGGIVGGDALAARVRLEPGTAAVITSQAAEKVYRSAGAVSSVGVHLDLGKRAWLEWLPQETILFDGARLRRHLQVDLAPDARLLAAEMLVFGRRARGEHFRKGFLQDRWTVRCDGRLVWADALFLTDDCGALIDAPFGFGATNAAAICIHIAPDAADRLELARALVEWPNLRSGVTCMGPVLIARWLADDPAALRRALGQFCARFRHLVGGLPERLPAVWAS